MVCPVSTVSHIPHSVRPLLAHVLSLEFQKACSVWGFVRLLIFARLFYALLVFSLTIAIVMLLVPCFWITFICGHMWSLGLNLFGLYYRMI